MIAGVVVDVDDTLYLERDYVRSGFEAVDVWGQRELGVKDVGRVAMRLFEEGTRGTTITDALEQLGLDADERARAAAIGAYRDHTPTISLLPDARKFLEHVYARWPLAVITDGPATSQRAKIAALGLNDFNPFVVVTDEWNMSKPDPRTFKMVQETFELEAGQLVYLADNPLKDFDAPQSLGWHSVRIKRRGSLHVGEPSPPGVTEFSNLGAAASWLDDHTSRGQ